MPADNFPLLPRKNKTVSFLSKADPILQYNIVQLLIIISLNLLTYVNFSFAKLFFIFF